MKKRKQPVKKIKNKISNKLDAYAEISKKYNVDVEFLGREIPVFSLMIVALMVLNIVNVLFIPFYKDIKETLLIDHTGGFIILSVSIVYMITLIINRKKINLISSLSLMFLVVYFSSSAFQINAKLGSGAIIGIILQLLICTYTLATYRER